MTRISALAALLALAPALAAAQAGTQAQAQKAADAPQAKAAGKPAAKPSPVARDLARALTTPETWDGILDAYATSLSGQISAALAASGKEPAPDLREKIRGDLRDTVKYDEAIELQARALATRFSQEDLAALERFYRAGPGKKLLDVLPEVSREVNDDLRTRLSERVPAIVQRHAPSLAQAMEGGDDDAATGTGSGAGAAGSGAQGAPAPGGPAGKGDATPPEGSPPPRR